MDWMLDGGRLCLVSARVSLRAATPVLNGVALEEAQAESADAGNALELRYRAPGLGGGAFGVEARREEGGGLRLRWWVEGLPAGVDLDSFGLRFAAVENLRAYLRNGYFSWDGSFYVQPDALGGLDADVERPETGYAATQLLPWNGGGGVVLGCERCDRFQQTFTFDTRTAPPALTILTLWDRKAHAPGARCASEWLLAFEHEGVEEGLRAWARALAAASPTPPRTGGPPIAGWCSWYTLYASITEGNIRHHLRTAAETARREDLPLRVFQIDDGFTPEMGDWLEVKPQFPRGMKPLLDEIRAAGFTPGLWIAPFMVGNRSRLYAEHPDWVVRDRESGGPLAHMRFYGEFRWHKRSEEYYILDATHPDAFAYLRGVFRAWRREWGCAYFKTDFMHFGSEYGPDRALWHTPGRTRIEIWRSVAEMIREEIGDALWLGCGCPLWASVGLVDAVRTGRDIGVEWLGGAQSLLRDQAARNFANHVLWQSDPDCILLRERFHHLSAAEVRDLATYAGMAGGVVTTSDDLAELSRERLGLLRLLLSAQGAGCRFPLLGETAIAYERIPAAGGTGSVRLAARAADPVLVQVRGLRGGGHAVFIFNTGDAAVRRTYPLARLGIPGAQHVYDWAAGAAQPGLAETLRVALAAHEGALLLVTPEPLQGGPDLLAG